MAIINRIVVVALLAGVFVLSISGALYSLDLLGYRLADLAERSSAGSWLERAAQGIAAAAAGTLSAATIAWLLLVLLAGLVVLVLELWPGAPARIQVTPGVYVSRRAVRDAAEDAAAEDARILEASARVKARRSTGADVALDAFTRRGDADPGLRGQVGARVKQRLEGQIGVPVRRLRVHVAAVDPRTTKARVR